MRIRWKRWPGGWIIGAAAIALSPAGCSTTVPRPATLAQQSCPALHHAVPSADMVREPDAGNRLASHESTPLIDRPMAIEDLLALALANNPELAIAQTQASAARGRLVQVGLYPNPTFTWEAERLGDKLNGAGEQGPELSQEIVTGRKLQLAQAAAAHGVTAADWDVITRWYALVRDVRIAFYDVLTAEEDVKAARQILADYEKQIPDVEAFARGTPGAVADPARAKAERDQILIRVTASEERKTVAWRLLAAALGMPTLPPCQIVAKDLSAPPPEYAWEPTLATVLIRSSEVQSAQAALLQADEQVRLARAQNTPNLQLSARPSRDFPEQDTVVRVEVGVKLPVFDRNQGNILAAEAGVARAAAEARRVQVDLAERLAAAFQRYNTAHKQIQVLGQLSKNAEEAFERTRTLFRDPRSGVRFFEVLDAQRNHAFIRLNLIQARGELWRAVAELEGLLQNQPSPLPLPGECVWQSP